MATAPRPAVPLPHARVRTLQHQLPGLSMGEGVLESRPGGYQPVGEHRQEGMEGELTVE